MKKTKIKLKGKDPIARATYLGACVMLMLQGETIKFENVGIKYTLKRMKEK